MSRIAKYETKECLGCHKEYTSLLRLHSKYCTIYCFGLGHSKQREVTCLHCGSVKKVKPFRANEFRFCSHKCSGLHYVKEKSRAWKGGRSLERELWQGSDECKQWRRSVFERDGFACVICGSSADNGTRLQADHIKPWSIFPELRSDIYNGRTLCVPCHKNTNTWGSKIKGMQRSDFLPEVL